jgi:putative endonuclease
MQRRYYVYLLTNRRRTVLYTGVTNDLRRRVEEHRQGQGSALTHRYNVRMLVYFEAFAHVNDAIAREKQIKAGSRQKKVALVESVNPGWRDLSDALMLL